jgi:tetratricopeptide (TPR) repeat protein
MRRICFVLGVLLLAIVVPYLCGAAQDAKAESAVRGAEFMDDIFDGMNGDTKALSRGLKRCDDALAVNPKHAEALVWRGAARMYQSGEAFKNGKFDEGMALWNQSLKDMDEAVALSPHNVGVRIPRASVLLAALRSVPPFMGKPLVAKALDDFETIYTIQKDELDKLGTHPRGELRMGLADVYRLAGQSEKSNAQLEAVVKELPDSKYAARAKEWLAAKPDAHLAHSCIGCHKLR